MVAGGPDRAEGVLDLSRGTASTARPRHPAAGEASPDRDETTGIWTDPSAGCAIATRYSGLVSVGGPSPGGGAVPGVTPWHGTGPKRLLRGPWPPGHHAESRRPMGFCLANNRPLGAFRARAVYGYKRVAVIDFNVHHATVTRRFFWDDAERFLCLYPPVPVLSLVPARVENRCPRQYCQCSPCRRQRD